jgi:hypothetical protein
MLFLATVTRKPVRKREKETMKNVYRRKSKK